MAAPELLALFPGARWQPSAIASNHKSKVIRDVYFHRFRHIICFTHEAEFVSAPVSSS
ncbi:hypothetical protein ACKVV1_005640 [Pyricularia oryzae]